MDVDEIVFCVQEIRKLGWLMALKVMNDTELMKLRTIASQRTPVPIDNPNYIRGYFDMLGDDRQSEQGSVPRLGGV